MMTFHILICGRRDAYNFISMTVTPKFTPLVIYKKNFYYEEISLDFLLISLSILPNLTIAIETIPLSLELINKTQKNFHKYGRLERNNNAKFHPQN